MRQHSAQLNHASQVLCRHDVTRERCALQDVVARGQKFFIYKRPGQRVLISSQGYMLV